MNRERDSFVKGGNAGVDVEVAAFDISNILKSKNPKPRYIIAKNIAAPLYIAACKILGYKPENIATLIRAKERYLIGDYEDLEIIVQFGVCKIQQNHWGSSDKGIQQ